MTVLKLTINKRKVCEIKTATMMQMKEKLRIQITN